MQKKLVLFFAFVLLLTPVLATGIRPAKSIETTIISQNFDNESTGIQPNRWVSTWPPLCSLTVNDTIYHGSSGKSARYVDTVSNSTGYSRVERTFVELDGQLEFSFAIMAENPDNFSLYIDNGYFCGANIYFLPNMTLAYYDGEYHYLRQFSLNTWYEIKMDINATAHIYDIYVDGSLEAQGAHFSEGNLQTWFLNRIVFGENPYGMPSGYIDDLSLIAHVNPPEPSALLKIANPFTGEGWFNFSSNNMQVGDTFIANITVSNVSTLCTWQIGLTWNASLLEWINITLPSDNVFALAPRFTDYPIVTGGPVLPTPGLLLFGASICYPDEIGFSGSGVLAQAEFKILQKDGQCDLSFEGIDVDTFLLHWWWQDSIPFTPVNGYYSFTDQTLIGDVNFDGTADMRDVGIAILAFNSFPNTPRWNAFADLDGNGRVDMRDVVLVVLNFGKHV
jgi:hypothetical protein